MSADNGVYIIETKGPEYRIAYAHNIDSIYGAFDDTNGHWKGDPKMIKGTFGKSKVYKIPEEALDKAQEIAYSYEYLEDGVCLITDFKDLDFSNL